MASSSAAAAAARSASFVASLSSPSSSLTGEGIFFISFAFSYSLVGRDGVEDAAVSSTGVPVGFDIINFLMNYVL